MAITSERRPSRAISGVELVVGVAIVLGHNLWHVLPNEVPILCALGLLSVRLREGRWAALGFRRPASWRTVIALAVGASALRIGLGELVIEPVTSYFWPPATAPSGLARVAHDPMAAARWLVLVWTFAAIGEEVGYRGYLTKRAADLGAGSRVAWIMATIAVTVVFGLGHAYKGPAGVLDSACAGAILGATYLLSGRCLWTTIVAHGLIDTTAIALVAFGWA